MTKLEINKIHESLSVLIGQPMTSIGRSGIVTYVNFGELIEVDDFLFDKEGRVVYSENKKPVTFKVMEGKYAIEGNCCTRFICDDEIILSKRDISLPNTQIGSRPDFSFDNFKWHIPGNNYYDEAIDKYRLKDITGFIIKKIEVSKFGDLTILFGNGYALEYFMDTSSTNDAMNWNFHEITATRSIITVSSSGIQKFYKGRQPA